MWWGTDETLLGKDGFRKGMDLYFERHDGQAVTCDDFLAAMADANGEDLSLMNKCVCHIPGALFLGRRLRPCFTVSQSQWFSAKSRSGAHNQQWFFI